MGRAAGGQRERGHPEEQHEQDREAPLAEQIDQAPERLVALPGQPALELVAEDLAWWPGSAPLRASGIRRDPITPRLTRSGGVMT